MVKDASGSIAAGHSCLSIGYVLDTKQCTVGYINICTNIFVRYIKVC